MYRNDNSPPRRAGFTLVELLAVVVIIAILATLTTVATTSAMQGAREAKTRGTILKLDTAIQDIFEGYDEKFLQINLTTEQEGRLRNQLGLASGAVIPDEYVQLVKIHFIRDLMRMEMPMSWDEVNHNDNDSIGDGPVPIGTGGNAIWMDKPAVLQFYRNAIGTLEANSAELLFLIIMNLNPEALENFHDSEIGDYDGNGLYEFHDAWGTPIIFLRWAPGFTDTDKQPDVVTRSGYALSTNGDNTQTWVNNNPASISDADWNNPTSNLVAEMQNAVSRHHDPFDGRWQLRSWFLYPVAVSAGPDKKFDLYMTAPAWPASMTGWSTTSQPILDPFEIPMGIPQNGDNDGVLNHYDNIHNHRISGGF